MGASIVFSLIGRGQIADLISKPTGPADRMRLLREQQLADLEREDAENFARTSRSGGGGGGDSDEEEEEGGDDE